MPLYLCKPGQSSPEPWRHGVQVYAQPFYIQDTNSIDKQLKSRDRIKRRRSAVNSTVDGENISAFNRNATSHPVLDVHDSHHPDRPENPPTRRNNSDDIAHGKNNNPPIRVADRRVAVTTTNPSVNSIGTANFAPLELTGGTPIRRVRHAEIVLVDQVAVHYGRYWLRLRWPGPRGGVAGYIALGSVSSQQHRDILAPVAAAAAAAAAAVSAGTVTEFSFSRNIDIEPTKDTTEQDASKRNLLGENTNMDFPEDDSNTFGKLTNDDEGEEFKKSFIDIDDKNVSLHEDDNFDDDFAPTSEAPSNIPIRCDATGLYFPSSATMELLGNYEDGLNNNSNNPSSLVVDGNDSVATNDNNGEPVFCRICREGLHDVNYDTHDMNKESSALAETNQSANAGAPDNNLPIEEIYDPTSTNNPLSPSQAINRGTNDTLPQDKTSDERDDREPFSYCMPVSDQQSQVASKPPLTFPKAITHHPYAENPLLAPCECAGSMAFVHYLCVEQWRCRSHHPTAKNGLNCETCGGAYSLPPPPSRPSTGISQGGAPGPIGGEEDWLQAMPPHVLAALQRPHLCWRIGAAIVRRRWLRPIAPVVISPIVALYCRARRTLKKRGVSRRRWACSLCRRRARWKCVRCLRSYYCSRQCQNVSWHIVHKHVCYKRGRFWWSVLVYSLATILLFPGVLKNPAIYDLGLTLLIASFLVMGAIGGGLATITKRILGIDIRGRSLEIFVVSMTLCLASINWGIIWAFFGDTSRCWGVSTIVDSFNPFHQDPNMRTKKLYMHSYGALLNLAFQYIFRPGEIGIHMMDKIVQGKTGINVFDKILQVASPQISRWICVRDSENYVLFDGSKRTLCLQMAKDVNSQFFLPEHGGEKCASDFNTVASIWLFSRVIKLAGFVSMILKKRDRDRRIAARPRVHQHQD